MSSVRHAGAGPLRSKAGTAKRTPARYSADRPRDAELAQALRLHRAARYAEAAALYDVVVQRDPASLDAWMNLGGALVRLGRAQEAAEALRRGIELGALDPRVHRDAAMGFVALGAWAEAEAAYQRALSLDETLLGARLGLARLCLEAGDREAAIRHARRATEHAPEDASSWLELHRARFDDQAPGPAIDAARRALELRPSYGLARLFLGALLLWDGASREGRDILAAGSLDPGLVDALDFAMQERGRARATASTRETQLLACAATRLDGPVLELGVRHGISTRVLAAHAGAPVHAFDSFHGLPSAWHGQPSGSFSTAGLAPAAAANVTFHAGWFEDTLPPFAASLTRSPRLVHVDCDTYDSTTTALRALGPCLAAGTVVLFDEYLGNSHWREDEHRAFQEAVATHGWRYDVVALSWITGQLCVKLIEPTSAAGVGPRSSVLNSSNGDGA